MGIFIHYFDYPNTYSIVQEYALISEYISSYARVSMIAVMKFI